MPDKKATREGEEVMTEEEAAAAETEAVNAMGWEQMNREDYEKVAAGEKPSFQVPVEEEVAAEEQPEQLR